ncbi:hypothetical protein BLOT_003048 [Blomia tropicalis]|nr:hypothetical protein BLOT_003048 [Blomia tropicalis]
MNRDCSKIQCPVEETVAIFYVVDVVEMVRVARTGTESTGSEIKTRPKCSQLLNVVVLCVVGGELVVAMQRLTTLPLSIQLSHSSCKPAPSITNFVIEYADVAPV